MLSAMQVSKGAKKRETIFLAILKVEEPKGKGSDVLMEVVRVLDSFKNLMSVDPLKKLLPRWGWIIGSS